MSQVTSPHYVYRPLQFQDSIRLLELHPGPKGSPLRCNITEVRRSERPRYEALSYAWGEAVFPHTIEDVSSGTRLSITLNLFTALHGIRYEQTSRLLWIDALCIDQSELKEKNHQVASMGDIFQNAWRVIVWLGHHKGAAVTIISLLEILKAGVQSIQEAQIPDGGYRSVNQALIRLRYLQFFEQPWYDRQVSFVCLPRIDGDIPWSNRLLVADNIFMLGIVVFGWFKNSYSPTTCSSWPQMISFPSISYIPQPMI